VIVTTRKVPFKLVLRERRPLIIEVSIRNNKSSERKYVVSAEADRELSFSPTGLAKYETIRTQKLYPGEATVVSFKVYPRTTTRPGTYAVKIIVDECIDDYEHVVESKELDVKVPVV
jgi:uncharacterized membrane protein